MKLKSKFAFFTNLAKLAICLCTEREAAEGVIAERRGGSRVVSVEDEAVCVAED